VERQTINSLRAHPGTRTKRLPLFWIALAERSGDSAIERTRGWRKRRRASLDAAVQTFSVFKCAIAIFTNHGDSLPIFAESRSGMTDFSRILGLAFTGQSSILQRMTTLLAHFDGKVLVPDSPVKLPMNQPLKISVSPVTTNGAEEDDLDEGAWLRAASEHSAFDFLREEPNLYRSTDGKPFHDAR
jgi:hypothetical protein